MVNEVAEQLDSPAKNNIERVVYAASAEQFPVFAWLALIFIILDIFMLDRKIGWLKKINFFSKQNKKL